MFSLTTQERKVILFVLGMIIIGIGIDFLCKSMRRDSLIDHLRLQQNLFEKVNINTATTSELRTIPGVGDELAAAIVDYRKAHGEFKNLDQLKAIKGIKDKKIQQLRGYIVFEKSK